VVDARGRAGRSRGGATDAERPSTDDLDAWLAGRLPETWFAGPPEVVVDRDEILVVGRLPRPGAAVGDEPAAVAAAEAGVIARFREETREARMAIAHDTEHRFWRTVSWGAEVGGTCQIFTNLSVPVMTRLRQPERQVLDTLVDAGVARSRSEALAWCVKLVGANADPWLAELREAMASVDRVRRRGPHLP
jgi:hypothetical protein